MTTASIYYRAPEMTTPHFILIDGDREFITGTDLSDGMMGGDWKLRGVNNACRRLGWRTAPGAKIVRQADGRGTVPIVPTGLLSGLPGRTPIERVLDPVATLTQAPSADEDGQYVITVAIDGKVDTAVTGGRLEDLDPKAAAEAVNAVTDTLAAMGYDRTGPAQQAPGGHYWTCTVTPRDPVDEPTQMQAFIWVDDDDQPLRVEVPGAPIVGVELSRSLADTGEEAPSEVDAALLSIGFRRSGPVVFEGDDGSCRCWTCPVREARWQDHPTLVRMDDTTAAALKDMSEKLSIPADELAGVWIRQAAADALYRYHRDTAPGYVAAGNRISRWLPDGSAMIERDPGAPR